MAYYGFETIPEPHPLPLRERLHRLGENILISFIVLRITPRAPPGHAHACAGADLLLRRILESEFATGDKAVLGA